MKRIFVAAVIALSVVPADAVANERLGGMAAGALAGALVLGPIGAVAGAAIGYGAGSAVAHSRAQPELQRPAHAAAPPRTNTAARIAPAVKPAAVDARSAVAVPLPPPKPAATEARAAALTAAPLPQPRPAPQAERSAPADPARAVPH
jgi:hypothetical protein